MLTNTITKSRSPQTFARHEPASQSVVWLSMRKSRIALLLDLYKVSSVVPFSLVSRRGAHTRTPRRNRRPTSLAGNGCSFAMSTPGYAFPEGAPVFAHEKFAGWKKVLAPRTSQEM